MVLCEVKWAWCGCTLGHKEIDLPEGMPPVTHGICPDCYEREIAPRFSEGVHRLADTLRKEE